jgi:hypothetical protein
MWRTQFGDRRLEGAEAILFAEALSSQLDEVTSGTLDDYELGVECFDNLTFGQRISVLSIIGNGLLRKDVPLVRLTAILDGAITFYKIDVYILGLLARHFTHFLL